MDSPGSQIYNSLSMTLPAVAVETSGPEPTHNQRVAQLLRKIAHEVYVIDRSAERWKLVVEAERLIEDARDGR